MRFVQTIDARTLHDWVENGEALLIDVREAHEYARGHIPGSVLMPLSRLATEDLPEAAGRRVVVCCASGARSLIAADRMLAAHYGSVFNLHGGMSGWQIAGFGVDRDENAGGGLLDSVFSMFRNAG